MQYEHIAEGSGRKLGNSATVGIEDPTGTIALLYSFNEAGAIQSGLAVLYYPP